MTEQKPTPTSLLRKFASLRGLRIYKRPKGLACKMADGTVIELFDKPDRMPTTGKMLIVYGMLLSPSEKHIRSFMLDANNVEHLSKKLEEGIEILELREKIMDPKNLETAERMAKKRDSRDQGHGMRQSRQTEGSCHQRGHLQCPCGQARRERDQ